MLITIEQLKKQGTPFNSSEELDLSNELLIHPGIKDVSLAQISGQILTITEDTFKFSYSIHLDLNLECARTLVDIPFTIDDSFVEYYSIDPEQDAIMIESNTIDTSEAILGSVLINLPMRVVSENSCFESEDEPDENKPFSKLKDLL